MPLWTENSILVMPNKCRGIGDQLTFTRLPEFYYREFGKSLKIAINDCHDIYKSLPHVTLVDENDITADCEVINLWWHKRPMKSGSPVFKHTSMFVDNIDSNIKPTLGRDSSGKKQERIAFICSQGAQKNRVRHCESIPINDLNKLSRGLAGHGYQVIQIGGKHDKVVPYSDSCLGLSIQETYDLLGWGSVFIGVNSGMMHLANAISSIRKVIYMDTDVTLPISSLDRGKYPHHDWLYDDNEFIGHREYKNVITIDEFLESV